MFLFSTIKSAHTKLDKRFDSLLKYLIFILHWKEKEKYSVFLSEDDNLFYLLIDKILGPNN